MSIIMLSVIMASHFDECHLALCYSTERNTAVILMSHSDEHYFGECFCV
jgi:hypothetical protein